MDWATNRNDGVQRVSLLSTKFQIARARPGHISRPSLLDRLTIGLQRKLTIVAAPAGYGKTALLAEWARVSRQTLAWISLDREDNEPARFWAYFIGSLRRLHPELEAVALDPLQRYDSDDIGRVLIELINELALLPQELAVVLDDYHLIENAILHRDLSFFIERMPPHLHLYIASRTVPPLKLTRLRADREVAEIGVVELRFTPDEAMDLLRAAGGSTLMADELHEIVHDMAGWAAGLQLTGFALAEKRPSVSRGAIPRYRYVTEYLREEILDQQPDPVRMFLLKSSILDRMRGDLCDALTGEEGGEKILEDLLERNLFIDPADQEEGWYRYHPMFLHTLRQHMADADARLCETLHQCASGWFATHDSPADAVEHLLRSGDVERAVEMAEQCVEPLLADGRLAPILSWHARLPDERMAVRPKLAMAFAWAFLLSNDFHHAQHYITLCRNHVERVREQGLADIEGHLAAIDRFFGDMHLPDAHGREVPASWERSDFSVTPGHAIALQGIGRPSGPLPGAARPAGIFGLTRALPRIARLQKEMGQLRYAAASYRQALQLLHGDATTESADSAAKAHLGLGEIHFEWNDLDSTMRNLGDGLRLSREARDPQASCDAHILLARVHQARGDLDGALDAIAEGERVLRQRGAHAALIETLTTHRVEIWLAQGKLKQCVQWMQSHQLHHTPSELREQQHLLMGAILLAQYHSNDAIESSGELIRTCERVGRNNTVIRGLILQTLAHDQQGDTEGSIAALSRALSLAEPEGYIRAFMREPGPMARILRTIREDESSDPPIGIDYIETLLAALGGTAPVEMEPRIHHEGGYHIPYATAALLSPLSERELEVLRLIAAGKSNAAIADALYISLSTVKSHINNLYSKLGVESRTQALVRAKEISLL